MNIQEVSFSFLEMKNIQIQIYCLKNLAKNIVNPIVTNWLRIVAREYDIDLK